MPSPLASLVDFCKLSLPALPYESLNVKSRMHTTVVACFSFDLIATPDMVVWGANSDLVGALKLGTTSMCASLQHNPVIGCFSFRE